MEHLLATGNSVESAVAHGKQLLTRVSTTHTDGILDALAKFHDTEHARQLLREANIAITKEQIRESVKPDAHLIHAITAVEELDRVANTLAKRVRDWYALYDPETERRITDHPTFIEAVLQAPAQQPNSMGGEINEQDLSTILMQAASVHALYIQRAALVAYLEDAMSRETPNLKRVAGATIGAKLLGMAGSLTRLASMPAGTIQLLGAETALFRHLRNRAARPPKHGVIFNHQVIQHARPEDRGRIARALADTIAIAARVDRFKGEYIGDALAIKVEQRAQEVRLINRVKPAHSYEDRAPPRQEQRSYARAPQRKPAYGKNSSNRGGRR